jgi:hypothetical protein
VPITAASIRLMAYRIGVINVANPHADPVALTIPPYAGAVRYRGEHTMYPTTAARFTQNITAPVVGDARATVAGVQSNIGDAVFLKYFDDAITSVRLPCPAGAVMNLFVTDNLSGCKFYVDSIVGSNDLIVYHANTHQHTAGPASDADFQQPAAAGVLDAMHLAARGDYAPLVLNAVASCALPVYFQEAGNRERAKRAKGRTSSSLAPVAGAGPKFLGGCTIVGFPVGATWQFYYQTWGDMSYKRPSGAGAVAKALFTVHWHNLHKLRVEGAQHTASLASMRVIDTGLIV